MVGISTTQQGELLAHDRVEVVRHNAAVVSDTATDYDLTPLCRLLENEGFSVTLLSINDLLAHGADTKQFDVVLLDVIGLEKTAEEVCIRLRQSERYVPIIVLSEENNVTDRIKWFEAGGDDFIGKPFSAREISARLRTLLRRSGTQSPQHILRYEDLSIDLAARVAYRGDRYIDLSRREFALLVFLMRHAEQVISREQFLENVWSNSTNQEKSNVVDVYINYVRNKTEQGRHNRLIQTVRGKGYMLHRQRVA